jgi:hypothetical protein
MHAWGLMMQEDGKMAQAAGDYLFPVCTESAKMDSMPTLFTPCII